MECLYWPVIHGDCHRSDITDTDLHGAAQPGLTQYTDTQPLIPRTLAFVWPDKLLEPCSEQSRPGPLLETP